MTLTMLIIATTVAAVPAVAFGFWWRGRLDRSNASTSTQPADDGAFALVEIQLFGDTVRTQVRVDVQRIEALANGMGKTLSDLPSTAKH
ncbi:MAG TPA: hypothetical protein VLF18_08535 [Tahibacter sp.]|uniref:hypothetical protein n=1 Tax=Tahibacter sp. TaxID=2056211 RepID=UPI002CA1E4E8|nr:hypothetical protein [Tahibacter sp.]HSX60230.1 hypothetical protein [Tahibacter sp.]